ncbi:sensor histidine kinase [Cypionkella psychrotolerans]|uniref:sensor histidine kinase n=1 Tax=Cypionkella psychrotolerans TaxID=1678131 RepID=UPI000B1D82F0|nr:ATP-binding protein [Cypionkella psychrotolerans]
MDSKGQAAKTSAILTPAPWMPRHEGWAALPRLPQVLGAMLFLAVAALGTHLTQDSFPEPSGLFLFFVAVLLAAVRFGFWIGIATAIAAFALFNFLFVAPLYTLAIAKPGDLLVLAEFLCVAGLTGFLAGRLREEANAAKSRAAVLEVLSAFATDLAEADEPLAVEQALVIHATALAHGPALVLHDGNPDATDLQAPDLQAAERAFRRHTPQDAAEPGQQGGRYTFLPLMQQGQVVLVLGYHRLDAQRPDRFARAAAIEVICHQANLALERLRFAQAAEEARTAATREQLRAALLTSLSHDLRTPLATILGAITSLRQLGASLPPEARDDLALAIEEEAQRLANYVDNLLHMTRLQAGLALHLVWVDPADVIAAAVARAHRAFPLAEITADLPDLPMIRAESALLEQSLFNLIDNAVKFSTPPARIQITARAQAQTLTLTVTDQGPGIAPEALAQIFTPFFRANPSFPGTGLGLTICHGIAAALGGNLTAESPVAEGHGTAMHISLPLPKAAA